MAGQGLFFKTPKLLCNSRFLFNNRLPYFNQISGIKQKVVNKLKELNVPEKPKKPLTPYFKFVKDHRNSIVQQHPDWKVTQVALQCAADWKVIDPATKTKYENEFKTEMEQYAAKYLEYTKCLTNEQKQALKEYNHEIKNSKAKREQRKKLREYERPKRPVGAYMLYVLEQAKAQSGRSYVQLVSDLKVEWANLPKAKKDVYNETYDKAKQQYDKDLLEWELRMVKEGNGDLVRRSTIHALENSSEKKFVKSPQNLAAKNE